MKLEYDRIKVFVQDPIKSIQFSTSNPVSHAFDPDAKDGHDLLIGLNCGDGILFSVVFYLIRFSKIC